MLNGGGREDTYIEVIEQQNNIMTDLVVFFETFSQYYIAHAKTVTLNKTHGKFKLHAVWRFNSIWKRRNAI